MKTIKQTKEEQIKMFMGFPKRQLIEMLIRSNELIDILLPEVNKINDFTEDLVCDNCKCHSNMLYTTNKGTLCEDCMKIKGGNIM